MFAQNMIYDSFLNLLCACKVVYWDYKKIHPHNFCYNPNMEFHIYLL